jgi:ABC-2 type transport system permease protein
MNGFSFRRVLAMINKEFIQMRRDRLTFGMIVGIPILQLILFGFAINSDPKHLPTAIQDRDRSLYSRSLVAALAASDYFDFVTEVDNEAGARRLLQRGDVMFVVTVPDGFASDLLGGRRPQVLVETDASDPVAAVNAVAALSTISETALRHDLIGPAAVVDGGEPPFGFVIHHLYNPEGVTALNIVPGLTGTILTMTMVLMTALAVTRETERGTMENLLAMPVRPAEVMLGKILPYIAVGYLQVALILSAAVVLFKVPIEGSLALLLIALVAFLAANLAVGFTFSTLARNQLQAMQMTFFFFLPSILLSGFMFPFRGMPDWAQVIGECLPLTHFLRIVRGILLKGSGSAEIWPDVWPLLLFLAVASAIALKRYRTTLD